MLKDPTRVIIIIYFFLVKDIPCWLKKKKLNHDFTVALQWKYTGEMFKV